MPRPALSDTVTFMAGRTSTKRSRSQSQTTPCFVYTVAMTAGRQPPNCNTANGKHSLVIKTRKINYEFNSYNS